MIWVFGCWQGPGFFLQNFQTGLGAHQISWGPCFPKCKIAESWSWPVLRLRISGAVLLLDQYAFMAWRDKLFLYLLHATIVVMWQEHLCFWVLQQWYWYVTFLIGRFESWGQKCCVCFDPKEMNLSSIMSWNITFKLNNSNLRSKFQYKIKGPYFICKLSPQ